MGERFVCYSIVGGWFCALAFCVYMMWTHHAYFVPNIQATREFVMPWWAGVLVVLGAPALLLVFVELTTYE